MPPYAEEVHATAGEAPRRRATASDRLPYLFVVGCPRSGTTLLQRMLDHHPRLAVANDTHFIPRALEKVDARLIDVARQGADVRLTGELVAGVRAYHRFPRLGISDEAVERASGKSATYGEFVTALYGEFARQAGKPLSGEKTPDYVRRLPLLHALFPWTRSVHIVRDGRNVALSLVDWATPTKGPGRLDLWCREPVAVGALWWRWLVGRGCADGRKLGPDCYLEIKYEELVVRPARTLAGLVEFLKLPFATEMLAYHRGKQVRAKLGLSAKSAWLPPTSGLRDWKTHMSARDLELFEALAGDRLEELGYPRAVETFSAEVTEVAASCRAWWSEHMEEGRGG
ncbi:MAG: sulfotransferase [Pirellulales bacterium]